MFNILSQTLLLLLLSGLVLPAQTTGQAPHEENLYLTAFSAYLSKRNEMYESTEGLKKRDYLNVLVESDINLNKDFPTKIGRNTIEYLEHAARMRKFDKLRQPFRLIVFRPMENAGNKVVISFAEYMWSYKRNGFLYSLSDGAQVVFRFDCEKQSFIVDKVELWGI